MEVHSGIYICNAIVSTVDYGLLLAAKLIGRADNPFTLQIGGIRILLVVWLIELVILGLLLAEIEYNPANAVRFTRNLSDVYRYVLQSQDKTLITLGEELEFIQSYLFLHEVRLGNCITCNITIPTEAMEYQLPPLTLQLLVENVIKHNSINSNKPMDITIQIVDHFLVVSNPIHTP